MKISKLCLFCLVASTLILSVAACGEQSGTEASLDGTSWRLVSMGTPGSETPAIAGQEPTLEFQDGGQAVGSGGCNSFGARYEVSGGSVSFTEMTSTLMACEQNVMDQEQLYFEALRTAGDFQLSGDQLTIDYGDGLGVLNLARAG